ncbi:MAG: inositol monophosphatase [Deltaproteobacteria bacterium]|nr:inositol monophosphatase [Deltaproteobacteria bacterium]
MLPPADLMETCAELAAGAGRILAELFMQPRTVHEKAHNDLVTDADRASESWLLAQVRRRHPDHAQLVEESGAFDLAGAPYTWVMDPLDGTTNYAHGFPHFNVSVAVCTPDALPVAGAVADPMRDELFVAARGAGAWLRTPGGARRLSVTSCAAVSTALLATGFPYDRAREPDNNHAEHDAMSCASHGVRRAGAAALDLAYVAAGRLDGYWEAHLKRWDLAAGALLVLEAGGVVTGYDGRPFDGKMSAVVTAGPRVHADLLAGIADVRRARGLPAAPARSA